MFDFPLNFDFQTFVVTIVVGYLALRLAYWQKGRLFDLNKMEIFDKTIMSFFIGGIITVCVLLFIAIKDGITIDNVYDFISTHLATVFMYDLVAAAVAGLLIERYALASPEQNTS